MLADVRALQFIHQVGLHCIASLAQLDRPSGCKQLSNSSPCLKILFLLLLLKQLNSHLLRLLLKLQQWCTYFTTVSSGCPLYLSFPFNHVIVKSPTNLNAKLCNDEHTTQRRKKTWFVSSCLVSLEIKPAVLLPSTSSFAPDV